MYAYGLVRRIGFSEIFNILTMYIKVYICFARRGWLPNPPAAEDFFKKRDFFTDFKNAVIPQRVDGFLRSTPEMKARDAYVPFLLSKPLNKNEISDLS